MIVPLHQVDMSREHLKWVAVVLARHLPDREVWAYGSRVAGRSWRYSDLDLVVMGNEPINATVMEDVQDELSETLVPYIIDFKDWNLIPEHWQDEIMRCYAVIHLPVASQAAGQTPFAGSNQT